MKILAFSDFHGKVEILGGFSRYCQKIKPDLLVFTGDIVKGYARGDEWLEAIKLNRRRDPRKPEIIEEEKEDVKFYREFYEALEKLKIPTLCVPGNMDAPEDRFFKHFLTLSLQSENIHIVHNNVVKIGEYVFSGWGGEITENKKEDFFVLQYPRIEVEFGLKRMRYIEQRKILLFHNPPISNINLHHEAHRGSGVVNDLIRVISPKILFCGHTHMPGKYQILNTLVVNPGASKNRSLALVDTETEDVEFLTLD
ncbi:MAG: metallophosphoesterase family protein [bacterium]|nr:metallophosphoesterase family protein [bacterium]